MPANSVKPALSALVKAGGIHRPRHGYYALPSGVKNTPGEADTETVAYIPLSSAHASAGSGSDVWQPEIARYLAVHRLLIKRETGVDASRLVAVIATGTSMVPTIMPGDRLLIARQNGEPLLSHSVYVWRSRYDGLLIKRAILQADGSIALQGDSDSEPAGRIMPSDDDPPWHVIARVLRVDKPL
jgi:phage repressor protein C with HTH and peptisase S24 domain